jgi:hypothetical protein
MHCSKFVGEVAMFGQLLESFQPLPPFTNLLEELGKYR